MHKKMEAEAAWHRGNKVAEAGCAGLGNLAYKPSVHRGVSAGDSDSSREDTGGGMDQRQAHQRRKRIWP